MQKLLKKWSKEIQDIENTVRKELKKKGFAEFLILPQGETKIELIEKTKPRKTESVYGTQYVFKVKCNGKEYDWGVSTKSPLLRQIIQQIRQGKTKFTVIRAGEGKSTRYSLKT